MRILAEKIRWATLLVVALVGLGLLAAGAASASKDSRDRPIDRQALVMRHNVVLEKPDPLLPLTMGNGGFAFTADITGLQTFPEFHERGMRLATQSQWGWHSLPNPQEYKLADALTEYTVAGRKVRYASGESSSGGYSPAATWLRANPHRLHLGQIGLRVAKSDGSPTVVTDLGNTHQTLNLWTGLLTSRFDVQGEPIRVFTVCHPKYDLIAVRIESALLRQGRLAVSLKFPYGSADWGKAVDWEHPDSHTTQHRIEGRQADLTRILDADRYYVRVDRSDGCGDGHDGLHSAPRQRGRLGR